MRAQYRDEPPDERARLRKHPRHVIQRPEHALHHHLGPRLLAQSIGQPSPNLSQLGGGDGKGPSAHVDLTAQVNRDAAQAELARMQVKVILRAVLSKHSRTRRATVAHAEPVRSSPSCNSLRGTCPRCKRWP